MDTNTNTNTETKHTPTPWEAKLSPLDEGTRSKVYGPRHADGTHYAPICETSNRNDAAFIVRACNQNELLNRIADAAAFVLVNPSSGANKEKLDGLLGELAKARGEA